MNRSICPYLGTLDKEDQPAAAVEYPSLENQCFAAPANELLLLGDQATFCLASDHRHCPRYQALQRSGETADAYPEADATPYVYAEEPDERLSPTGLWSNLSELFEREDTRSRRRWTWVGALMLFMGLLLFGGLGATYLGWQLVTRQYLTAARNEGQITTLADEVAQPLYVIQTATSPAAVIVVPPIETVVATLALEELVQPTAAQLDFPPAVTPTPIQIDPNAVAPPPNTDAQPIPTTAAEAVNEIPAELPPPVSEPINTAPENITLPTPEINLGLEVPTRRPTPVFEVPTSTPTPEEPTATPSPTPILGTPVVNFAPLQYVLQEGQCTLVRWQVENVQAVYYENQGVDGTGQREECIDDEPETFTLAVILPDGNTRIYTTTIDFLPPTPTLTPTASFTPYREPEPTPTWTPDVATPTPTVPLFFGADLSVFGDQRRVCGAGSTCEFDLLVSNTGNTADSFMLTYNHSGPWPALICADGGDCAQSNLSLSNVAPGSNKLVKVKVSIPGDATSQVASYGLQAISNSSGGSVTSSVVTIEVEVP